MTDSKQVQGAKAEEEADKAKSKRQHRQTDRNKQFSNASGTEKKG